MILFEFRFVNEETGENKTIIAPTEKQAWSFLRFTDWIKLDEWVLVRKHPTTKDMSSNFVFRGMFAFLSNMHEFKNPIIIGEQKFHTVEHPFQMAKFTDPEKKVILMNLPAHKVKTQARKWSKFVRSDWTDVNLNLMDTLVHLKFMLNPDLMTKLRQIPGDIVEGNLWHDNFWGNCLCSRCKDIPGHNHLGRILMKIRDGR